MYLASWWWGVHTPVVPVEMWHGSLPLFYSDLIIWSANASQKTARFTTMETTPVSVHDPWPFNLTHTDIPWLEWSPNSESIPYPTFWSVRHQTWRQHFQNFRALDGNAYSMISCRSFPRLSDWVIEASPELTEAFLELHASFFVSQVHW